MGFRFSLLFEHDLFRKPATILGSSPRTGFFGIMLQYRCNGLAAAMANDRKLMPHREVVTHGRRSAR
jgi:hypothetical protein